MAPRGRLRKKNTRKDAAFDAMAAYGFPMNVIKETVKELLDVYGEQGWPFIEDSSYKVLLEAILEKVETEGQEKEEEEVARDSDSDTLVAEPLSRTSEPECPDTEPRDIASPIADAPWSLSRLVNNYTSCNGDVRTGLEGVSLDEEHKRDQKEAEDNDTKNFGIGSTSFSFSPPFFIPTSNPLEKRKPYHGWIDSDDEEDFVELNPGPLARHITKLLVGTSRKRRWDVTPNHVAE